MASKNEENNLDVIDDYYAWRLDFNVGIELEVAYDLEKRDTIKLACFKEITDGSINTSIDGAVAMEFVFKEKVHEVLSA